MASEGQGDLAELQHALLNCDSVERFLEQLRDVAASIVTSVSGEPPGLTAPFEDG